MFCQELAAQLTRDVAPKLEERGVALRCVGIGTLDVARQFCEHVPFPQSLLYTDPENAAYTALGLAKGWGPTFLQAATPLAIARRANAAADLRAATARWKPWLPPKSDQGLQQGGALVFEGATLLYRHDDPATGAHADLNEVLNAALR